MISTFRLSLKFFFKLLGDIPQDIYLVIVVPEWARSMSYMFMHKFIYNFAPSLD